MQSQKPNNASRREWMRSAGVLALAAAAPGALVAGAVTNPTVTPGALELLDEDIAKSMLGQEFEIASAQAHAVCRLVEVKSLRLRGASARSGASFSLDFLPLTQTGALVQDTYAVHHPVLGDFELLLVPHPVARGNVLVASFSRL